MKAFIIELHPSELDGKCWVAEITDEDKTFRLKREFQPEIKENTWELYDGWYQIHGQSPTSPSYEKEYAIVKNGQIIRNLNANFFIQHLDKIKSLEEKRLERIKYQINCELNEMKEKVPYDPFNEMIESQKDDLSFIENSSQAIAGLATIRKRKETIITQYQKMFENYHGE